MSFFLGAVAVAVHHRRPVLAVVPAAVGAVVIVSEEALDDVSLLIQFFSINTAMFSIRILNCLFLFCHFS